MTTYRCIDCGAPFFDWDDYVEHTQAHEAVDEFEAVHWKLGDYPDPWSGG